MAAANDFFSAISFITFILVCIPFPWHLEAWNTGTCLYMAWTALGCLIYFINSVIWRDNAINMAPVWCDITSKIIIGLSVGITASSLCINRRLYSIASVRSVTKSKAQKRREIMVDLAIGIGIPFLVMMLHFIVQGHRFDILEEIGCFPFTLNIWPAFVILYVPPLLLGLVSATYSVMSMIAFRKCQKEFSEILTSSSNLNPSRFFRLMALAGTEVLFGVPFAITVIVINATHADIVPLDWSDVHRMFWRVDQYPAIIWKTDPVVHTSLQFTRWTTIICGLVFFAFFGFADEAQKHYKLAFKSVAKRIGVSISPRDTTKINSVSSSFGFTFNSGSKWKDLQGDLPIYTPNKIDEKRISMGGISNLTSVGTSDIGSTIPSRNSTLTLKSFSNSLKPPVITPNDSAYSLTPSEHQPLSLTPSISDSFLDLSSETRNGNDCRL